MSDSKSGSKDNLNESNMPLLSDDGAEKAGETPEKEVVEMELEEKKDDSTEKGDDKKKENKTLALFDFNILTLSALVFSSGLA